MILSLSGPNYVFHSFCGQIRPPIPHSGRKVCLRLWILARRSAFIHFILIRTLYILAHRGRELCVRWEGWQRSRGQSSLPSYAHTHLLPRLFQSLQHWLYRWVTGYIQSCSGTAKTVAETSGFIQCILSMGMACYGWEDTRRPYAVSIRQLMSVQSGDD